MGASIGNAFGFERAGVEKVVAIIGDSTFIHAGIPSLIDMVYNKGKAPVIILDNGTTAMTGHQVHPGVGKTLKGEVTKKLDLEKLARAVGVEHVEVVNAWNLFEVKRAIKEAMELEGPSVVIVRGLCQRLPEMSKREITPFSVDESACLLCNSCFTLHCPAIVEKEGGFPFIIPQDCVACSLCAQLCPAEAIRQLH
jgi:indolepyruvate ferredoxin oxidoreductase alpha subunit